MTDSRKFLLATLFFLAAGIIFLLNDWGLAAGLCLWGVIICLIGSEVGDREPEA